MASVSFAQNYGDNINPTPSFIPYNAGGYFADSNIEDTGEYTRIVGNGFNFLDYDRVQNILALGNYNALSSYIYMDINSGTMKINAPIGLRIDANTAGTAGGTATHMLLNVNGINYKVQLLNL